MRITPKKRRGHSWLHLLQFGLIGPREETQIMAPPLDSELETAFALSDPNASPAPPREDDFIEPPIPRLTDRVVLLAGGFHGFGRELALAFVRAGADLILVCPEEDTATALIRRDAERCGRNCLIYAGEMTREDYCRDAVMRAVGHLGQLDLLVNLPLAHQRSTRRLSLGLDPGVDPDFHADLFIQCAMTQMALRYLRRGGVILNTIAPSMNTGIFEGESSGYHAIGAFTRTLAEDLRVKGIRINAVTLPFHATASHSDEVDQQELRHRHRRLAELCINLATSQVAHLNGRVFTPESLADIA